MKNKIKYCFEKSIFYKITKAQSGRWSAGFASSGFSVGTEGYGGVIGRTTIMGIVGGTVSETAGGTVSEISGGKFANGTVTGAFVHLFNAEGVRFIKYMKRSYPVGYDNNGKLIDLRNYYESTPHYTKKDVVDFFDKTADAGAALVVAGTVNKNPYVIAVGECIDVTATTFKIIVDDKTYQPYEIYNEYVPPWFTITPLK